MITYEQIANRKPAVLPNTILPELEKLFGGGVYNQVDVTDLFHGDSAFINMLHGSQTTIAVLSDNEIKHYVNITFSRVLVDYDMKLLNGSMYVLQNRGIVVRFVLLHDYLLTIQTTNFAASVDHGLLVFEDAYNTARTHYLKGLNLMG